MIVFFVLICVFYHKCVAFVIRKNINRHYRRKKVCPNPGPIAQSGWTSAAAARVAGSVALRSQGEPAQASSSRTSKELVF